MPEYVFDQKVLAENKNGLKKKNTYGAHLVPTINCKTLILHNIWQEKFKKN